MEINNGSNYHILYITLMSIVIIDICQIIQYYICSRPQIISENKSRKKWKILKNIFEILPGLPLLNAKS